MPSLFWLLLEPMTRSATGPAGLQPRDVAGPTPRWSASWRPSTATLLGARDLAPA